MFRRSFVILIAGMAWSGCSSDTGDPKVGECADYCALVTKHCSATVSQYGDGDACMATCLALPEGDQTAHSGNTIACRTFEAAAAEFDPTVCPKAGPGGDGVCGNNCDSFCQLADTICVGELAAYASTAECLTACAGFTSTPPFDSGDTAGNTFECRLYHLTAASAIPRVHCPHIGVVSPVCN